MNLQSTTAAKLGAYASVLVLTFGAAFALGSAVGPIAADAEAGAGDLGVPAVEFGTEFPTAGTYRLFAERPGEGRERILAGVNMDFQHASAVHTAEFTVTIDV